MMEWPGCHRNKIFFALLMLDQPSLLFLTTMKESPDPLRHNQRDPEHQPCSPYFKMAHGASKSG